ncbi:MAG: hypothetical protein H6538_03985 [Bacteroidales bacterium]|nr:hypothetical protein [Bacteroidales bacterium]MCB8998711.1 hypothetical protein [Bacteroidales bacterium]
MKKSKAYLLLLLIPFMFQISCKKDETPPAPTYREPSAASRAEIVDIPAGLQAKADAGSDYGAMIAVSYIGFANAISSYSASFAVPEGAEIQGKKGGSTVYHWAYGDLAYWMTYTELSDKYTWTYDYQYTGVPRFTFISAEEAKDGKSGSWTIYNPDVPSEYVWTYDWSINSSNTFLANLVWNEGNDVASFNVVSNSNNSGSFKYYVASVLKADINWNADGSGTYWISGDGGGDLSGSWTAK